MAADDQVAVNTVFANIGKAIAAYERKIVSGESAFDRYVAGDAEALSPSAVRGFQVFVASDCTLCHSGPEFSDREFHNLALGDRDWLPEDPDYGRYAGIQRLWDDPFNGAGAFSDDPQAGENKIAWLAMTDEQIGQFETPSLRDVALTAPYMHGGHFETLEDVVEFYSSLDEEGGTGHREHILQPLDLSAGEKADLVAFLESLTGEPPSTEWMTAP
jgi:cytochrome c peroxidase